MKHSGIYLTIIIALVICISIILALSDKENRRNEAENGLRTAIENAVENLTESKKDYTIDNTTEYVSDFIEQLIMQLDSNSEVAVSIVKTDYEKNMLSIDVTQTFTYLNGKKGTVNCEKTIVMDEPVPEEITYHTVSFYIENEEGEVVIFKSYQRKTGEQMMLSHLLAPVQEGKTFDGWRDSSGAVVDLTQTLTVNQDYSYFASWR